MKYMFDFVVARISLAVGNDFKVIYTWILNWLNQFVQKRMFEQQFVIPISPFALKIYFPTTRKIIRRTA